MLKIILILFGSVTASLGINIPTRDLNGQGVAFADLPLPVDLVFDLSDDEFEDYLAYWLDAKMAEGEMESTGNSGIASDGCSVSINMVEPTPVYEKNAQLIVPSGTSGFVDYNVDDRVTAICAGKGNHLVHNDSTSTPSSATMACNGDADFTGDWVSRPVNLGSVKCSFSPAAVETRVTECASKGTLIQIGAQGLQTRDLYKVCFDEMGKAAIYSQYKLTPENKMSQKITRPSFSQGVFFPGLKVDKLYAQKSQKEAIAVILKSTELANKYINGSYYLTRGHLAAMTDFVFAFQERATFTFINVVPQWQTFNGGNWNVLEQTLREHIAKHGYKADIFTGSWGVMSLNDASGNAKPIYLSPSNNEIPVPLWMYKVVHETSSNKATVFLGLNNPYVSLEEAKALAFCTDKCTGNPNFSWLKWNKDLRLGYSICCDVNDFRKTVNDFPAFNVSGLFT